MSNRATRRKLAREQVEAKRDKRQPIKLDVSRPTGNAVMQIVSNAVRDALNSDAAKLVISGFLEGRNESGGWIIRLRKLDLGEPWLIPERAEEEPPDENVEPPKDEFDGVPSAGILAEKEKEKAALNGAKK